MEAKNNKQNNATNSRSSNNNHKNNNKNINNKFIGHIVIPYMQSLGENFKNICSKFGIQTYFKGNKMLKNIFVSSKD